jgi:hypothetical protein
MNPVAESPFNLLSRVWRGELPLWQSFWIGLVGGSFALAGALRFAVIDVMAFLSVPNAVFAYLLLCSPILLLLWVSVWRAAERSSLLVRVVTYLVVLAHALAYAVLVTRYARIYAIIGA